MRRQSRGHHFSFAAHIIRSYPLPQFQLLIKNHRFHIQYIQDIFGFKEIRLIAVQSFYNACILLALAQVYFHPATGFYSFLQMGRHGPCVVFGQCGRNDDFSKQFTPGRRVRLYYICCFVCH
jgi:hypothetical protein